MSELLYKDGFKNITNIDFSKVSIERQSAKCKDMVEMKCSSQ